LERKKEEEQRKKEKIAINVVTMIHQQCIHNKNYISKRCAAAVAGCLLAVSVLNTNGRN
jgi:hypothetical protein